MLKSKKMLQFNLVLLAVLTLALALILPFTASTAKAETLAQTQSEQPDTRGLFTRLTLSLDKHSDGYLTATAKNEFTLGTSVIQVIVEIYSAYDIYDDYNDMILEARIATADLDIYDELSVTCPTGGVSRYWCAVMKYKHDEKDWVTKMTSVVHLDAYGNKIN